jgi:hypothetical protein
MLTAKQALGPGCPDELDAIAPVIAVETAGGTFRPPLWQEVLAAVFDRPL